MDDEQKARSNEPVAWTLLKYLGLGARLGAQAFLYTATQQDSCRQFESAVPRSKEPAHAGGNEGQSIPVDVNYVWACRILALPSDKLLDRNQLRAAYLSEVKRFHPDKDEGQNQERNRITQDIIAAEKMIKAAYGWV